ncbi:MAG: RTX toxin, partial [Pseudomonadota bacterium]
ATSASPNWVRLTDGFDSLSIGGLDLDPGDGTSQTLVAGVGRFSSFGRNGGDRIGLLRTTNGGAEWSVIDGAGTLVGANVTAVASRGDTILAAVNVADVFSLGNIGIFRSTNGGASFTQISGGDGSATGLPGGVTHDLGRDRDNPNRFFTSVTFADVAGGTNGVFRSLDTGASWTRISDPAIEALVINDTSNVEFSVRGDAVLLAIVNQGRLAGVFHSTNGGDNWTAMDLPTTVEDGVAVGPHPGGQGSVHLSTAIDPNDSDVVYLGGDRQPTLGEFSGGSGFFPNSIGAGDFSGRLFRGDARAPSGSQWTPLTHVGTASNSSPHADSREMAFDANGDLLEVDDGGVYRRTLPASDQGDWFSINGDLASTEYHGIAYDAISDIVIGGAQDIGTTEQIDSDGSRFRSVSTADGGDVAVDNAVGPSESVRYSSFQFLGGFRVRTMDAGNNQTSVSFPPFTPLNMADGIAPQFYTPLATNAIEGNRLLIAADNGLYESFDSGQTVDTIPAPGENQGEVEQIRVNAFAGDPIIYGVPNNADYVLVASDVNLFRRSDPPPALLAELLSPTAAFINDLAVNPDDVDDLFVVDTGSVYFSDDGATSWSDISGNLGSFDPGRLRTMVFVGGPDNAILVGADRGIFVAFASTAFLTWAQLGQEGLPNAPVFELVYDMTNDTLVAGLLGRGAWKYQEALDLIFGDRFE